MRIQQHIVMRTFPHIILDGKAYPTVIMGEDNFTGWFGKGKFASERERANKYRRALSAAYMQGVRGFSISPQQTLVRVLKEFRQSHPDILCIANPHWQRHYRLGKESLWTPKNLERLRASVNARVKPALRENYRLKNISGRPFTAKEIKSINLNEREYRKSLAAFAFCDFVLVGNIGISALVLLGRTDIIKREITLVRSARRIPLGMCEAGSLALPRIERLDVPASWVWINSHFTFPTPTHGLPIVRKATKPITAYKALTSPTGFNLDASIRFLKRIPPVESVVIGVENAAQAKQTFSRLHLLWPGKRGARK